MVDQETALSSQLERRSAREYLEPFPKRMNKTGKYSTLTVEFTQIKVFDLDLNKSYEVSLRIGSISNADYITSEY